MTANTVVNQSVFHVFKELETPESQKLIFWFMFKVVNLGRCSNPKVIKSWVVWDLEPGGGLVTWALTRCPLGLLTCWPVICVTRLGFQRWSLYQEHEDMWICDQIIQCRCPAVAVSTSPSSPRAQLSPGPRPHHYQALVTSIITHDGIIHHTQPPS